MSSNEFEFRKISSNFPKYLCDNQMHANGVLYNHQNRNFALKFNVSQVASMRTQA